MKQTLRLVLAFAVAAMVSFGTNTKSQAAEVYFPIVIPVTGFLSVEGASQRNGAIMAIEDAPEDVTVRYEIFDTGTSATGAATALERALNSGEALAIPSTVFGTEMVAMAPIAQEYKVPLLTISGLSKLTESDNPYIFRFLPSDHKIKVAQARYAADPGGARRGALAVEGPGAVAVRELRLVGERNHGEPGVDEARLCQAVGAAAPSCPERGGDGDV